MAEAMFLSEGVKAFRMPLTELWTFLQKAFSDDAKYRTYIRNITMNKGLLSQQQRTGTEICL